MSQKKKRQKPKGIPRNRPATRKPSADWLAAELARGLEFHKKGSLHQAEAVSFANQVFRFSESS